MKYSCIGKNLQLLEISNHYHHHLCISSNPGTSLKRLLVRQRRKQRRKRRRMREEEIWTWTDSLPSPRVTQTWTLPGTKVYTMYLSALLQTTSESKHSSNVWGCSDGISIKSKETMILKSWQFHHAAIIYNSHPYMLPCLIILLYQITEARTYRIVGNFGEH